jgi:3-dehydroquinate synthase
VRVRAGGETRDYDVIVRRGLLAELPSLLAERVRVHRWAVIADETVAGLYGFALADRLSGRGAPPLLLTFPAGEEHKSRESWVRLTDALLDAGCGRDTGILAFGGGVTGDLAGFVAATFLRGVPVVQVPTSLVAMIDSSVGGKTGVDTPGGKNLVGAFHPPRLVAVDPEATRTLPRRERAQGLVEAFKHGAILDAVYFDTLENDVARLLDGDPLATEPAVLRSVELKASVVTQDEREGDYRQILNFGHTIGHALEAASAYRLSHGGAVAIGMVAEARLGERLGVTKKGTSARLAAAMEALGLESRVPPGTDVEAVLAFLGSDKKRREGRVRFVLLGNLGSVDPGEGWTRAVKLDEVGPLLD